MNQETGKQLAHQLLIDTPALNDAEAGIKDCTLCKQATWSRAGALARNMSDDWRFTEEFVESGKQIPAFRDVVWPDGIVAEWDETLRTAHAIHANREPQW